MATDSRLPLRRIKTYTSSQGYVYQYYFVGKRSALNNPNTTEYIFDVSSDRKITFAVSIFLPNQVLQQWASVHGRSLNDAEQYGAVKLRLLKAFDEIENVMASGRTMAMDGKTMEELLSGLGVE